jgi:hypothetical protein
MVSNHLCHLIFIHGTNTPIFLVPSPAVRNILAPIPCFDKQLVEDRNINRLKDSFALRKAIYSSPPQLSQTALILFMNQCDLLEKKIKSGVSVKKPLPSFEDRPNDAASVTKCELSCGLAYMDRGLTLMNGWL